MIETNPSFLKKTKPSIVGVWSRAYTLKFDSRSRRIFVLISYRAI